MPAKFATVLHKIRLPLAVLLIALSATACAPDMFQIGRSSDLDAFLDRIVKNCGTMYINEYEVWLLADDEQDAGPGQNDYFIDQSSMLLYGTITPQQYITDISSFYDDASPRGMKAYQCIIAQLPQAAPPLPKAYKEVFQTAPQVSGND